MNLEKQRYPIGRFAAPETVSDSLLNEAITILEIFPENLKELLQGITKEELNTPYREGGWTVRQVVHHLADSHHNSYIRFKWTLTEDNPTIKAYNEAAWAALGDYATAPIAWSIDHLENIHHKLVHLLRMLTTDQWERTFVHPETGATMNLRTLALMYSWHSMHHYTHIKNALSKEAVG
ncbi:putative metal-dependent hydrolase [Aureisphaera galaxeae]|uniref:YfiT family bacillithiol transferase n=1 Tax=Aureisphaera galaxeae TaxID=1538023 RepID=UPI0023509D27|nr:putative metal-dependent hydrolase [Aureisphaera galaxeae]MDC8006328.1 putative metal-dependent hydrolase [Aureisphaera galaxeae]